MPRIVSVSDLTHLCLADHEWLIPGFFPKPGLVMILGEPRSGKSFLALQVSLALAQGRPLLPAVASIPPRKVLYFYFDKTGAFAFQDRLKSIQDCGVNLSGPLYVIHPDDKISTANLTSPDCYRYFQDIIKSVEPDVVVFDVLREFHNSDENESTDMKIVGDTLSDLCKGKGIIIVHHTKKLDYPGRTGPVRNIEAARGSNYIVGKADSTWLIHDGYLNIESNFAMPTRYKLARQKSGLWMFI